MVVGAAINNYKHEPWTAQCHYIIIRMIRDSYFWYVDDCSGEVGGGEGVYVTRTFGYPISHNPQLLPFTDIYDKNVMGCT